MLEEGGIFLALFLILFWGVDVPTIVFNAFSFLQKKLKATNFGYSNVSIEVPEGQTVRALIADLGLDVQDVEGVFINGKIQHMDSELCDGDRVAIFPPGTPGPYRLLLGMIKQGDSGK